MKVNPTPKPSELTSCASARASSKCALEYRATSLEGTRSFFCTTHQQWAYSFPLAVTYTYDDGSTFTKGTRS